MEGKLPLHIPHAGFFILHSLVILSLETSCDETAAAIVGKDDGGVRVLSSVVSSQIALHAPFGGVIPNLAAREHVRNIVPVIESALREAAVSRNDIDAIAVTAGPGLIPALQIGVAAAKTLSYLWEKPLLGIHHIEGHIYANFIVPSDQLSALGNQHLKNYSLLTTHYSPVFPLLALVVSGGHTELVLMRDHFNYEILGETEDDAVGEAFDKVAKMLGLPYPGGPEIARRASNYQLSMINDQKELKSKTKDLKDRSELNIENCELKIAFPRPLLDSHDYRFSFSGLKTAVLYFLKKNEGKKNSEHFINAVCHEFQEAALDVLIEKTHRATLEHQPRTVIIAGGVSANVELRTRMSDMITRDFPDTSFLMPPFEYSLDNAAMIGAAALFRWERMKNSQKNKALTNWQTLFANPNMKLGD